MVLYNNMYRVTYPLQLIVGLYIGSTAYNEVYVIEQFILYMPFCPGNVSFITFNPRIMS